MRRHLANLLALSVLGIMASALAEAQDYPKTEIFGGYSYFHSSFVGTGLSFNGGKTSVTANPTPWLGLTGDFGVYHRNDGDLSSNNFTYLFGPQFAYRGNEHVTPYFHVLIGGSHLSSTFSAPGVPSVSTSSNAFATAFGCGLDAKVSPHIAIRVAQVDYLLTKFQDDQDNRQNNVRISAGIIFRWGATGVAQHLAAPKTDDLQSAISNLPSQQSTLKDGLLKSKDAAEKGLRQGNHDEAAHQYTMIVDQVMGSQLFGKDKVSVLSMIDKTWDQKKIKAPKPISKSNDCRCETVGKPACVPAPGNVCYQSQTACASTSSVP